MKRLLLLAILPLITLHGYAQNTFVNLYGGAGTSTTYSYDVGLSGGLSYTKFGKGRLGLGGQIFYQSYNFLYDNEANSMHNGIGNAGVMILDKASYIFVAPKLAAFLNKRYTFEGYINVGAGFKMGGTETMRKWDRSVSYSSGDFDSTLNTTNNLNTMLFRIGIGFTEYLHLGGYHSSWWFTFTEDAGFITSSITKASDFDNPSRTQYSPDGKINPVYISLQIGISHASKIYHW